MGVQKSSVRAKVYTLKKGKKGAKGVTPGGRLGGTDVKQQAGNIVTDMQQTRDRVSDSVRQGWYCSITTEAGDQEKYAGLRRWQYRISQAVNLFVLLSEKLLNTKTVSFNQLHCKLLWYKLNIYTSYFLHYYIWLCGWTKGWWQLLSAFWCWAWKLVLLCGNTRSVSSSSLWSHLLNVDTSILSGTNQSVVISES